MKKIVLSGNIIEIYNYRFNGCGVGGFKMKKDLEQKQKNYLNTICKRRDKVRRLVTMNFSERFCKFLTLTFKENVTDISFANNEFKKFIKRLKYQFELKNLKYVAVIEFQERGAIHYHMIFNSYWLDVKKVQSCWGNGFVFIEDVSHVDNLGAYLIKYMTKDNSDIRLQNEKGYLYSKNLDRPIEFTDTKYLDLFYSKELNVLKSIKNKSPVYTSDFDSDFMGRCHYEQYNLKRL